jgi:hypothetical protein
MCLRSGLTSADDLGGGSDGGGGAGGENGGGGDDDDDDDLDLAGGIGGGGGGGGAGACGGTVVVGGEAAAVVPAAAAAAAASERVVVGGSFLEVTDSDEPSAVGIGVGDGESGSAYGESGVADDHFSLRVDLTTSGWRVLQAVVYDRENAELGRAYTVIDFEAPEASVKFENVTAGNAYGREVILRAATTGPVAAVEFFADRWSLGKIATGNSHAILRYTFEQTGRRVLRAVALGTAGENLGEDTVTVDIVP